MKSKLHNLLSSAGKREMLTSSLALEPLSPYTSLLAQHSSVLDTTRKMNDV